jgi:hypothetical protein
MGILIWFADHAVLVWAIIVVILIVLIIVRWKWIKDNKDYASALGTIAALIVTSAFATLQPAMTRIALQNNLIYQMLKDARATAIDFKNGRATSAEVFAVMQSIYIQYELGSINSDVWPTFVRDFCGALAEERLRRDWPGVGQSVSTPEFSKFIDNIVKPNSQDCK